MGIGYWSRFTRTAVIIVLWPYKSFSWTKLNEQREENLLILLCAGSISKDVKIWESCSYRILFQPILAVCRWNNILSNPNPDRIIIQPTYFEIEIYDIIQKKILNDETCFFLNHIYRSQIKRGDKNDDWIGFCYLN